LRINLQSIDERALRAAPDLGGGHGPLNHRV